MEANYQAGCNAKKGAVLFPETHHLGFSQVTCRLTMQDQSFLENRTPQNGSEDHVWSNGTRFAFQEQIQNTTYTASNDTGQSP